MPRTNGHRPKGKVKGKSFKIIKYLGIMTNEEYRNLKLQAHQQLVEDYHWLMSQSPAQYTWRCPQRWLIELVYNPIRTVR